MTVDQAFLLAFALITGIESALLYLGLRALLDGRLPTYATATRVVQGRPARVVGIIALLPIPVTLVVGTAVTALFASYGKDATDRSFFWIMTAVEAAVVVVCIVAIVVIGRVYVSPAESPRDRSDRRQAPDGAEHGPGAQEGEHCWRGARGRGRGDQLGLLLRGEHGGLGRE